MLVKEGWMANSHLGRIRKSLELLSKKLYKSSLKLHLELASSSKMFRLYLFIL